jgi:hypothetical protein
MNRQVWLARKIEFSWRLTLKHGFLDCQPAKESMGILRSQGNESAVKEIYFLGVTDRQVIHLPPPSNHISLGGVTAK